MTRRNAHIDVDNNVLRILDLDMRPRVSSAADSEAWEIVRSGLHDGVCLIVYIPVSTSL